MSLLAVVQAYLLAGPAQGGVPNMKLRGRAQHCGKGSEVQPHENTRACQLFFKLEKACVLVRDRQTQQDVQDKQIAPVDVTIVLLEV